MAIPFYENEEHLQAQQQTSEEVDQVDGHVMQNQGITTNQASSSPPGNTFQTTSHQANLESVAQQDFMAWKILAVAMCKALKDHYQQNMASSNSSFNSAVFETNSSTSAEAPQTAVIQILPNGQVKPQWN